MTDIDRILIVTVNSRETAAVLSALNVLTGMPSKTLPIAKRVYRDLGRLNGAHLYHALSEMGSGSPGASQQAVNKAIEALQPTMVIAVGVAFGIDPKSQRIGDILVSRQLHMYELQRVGADSKLSRGDKVHASTRLINLFEGVAQSSWQGCPVKFGVVLSGEKLVDNVDYRNLLNEAEPEAIGGEMEGAGVYASSQDHKVDWIVIKAICDWADGKKKRGKATRQTVAATNAASFVAHALSQVFHGNQAVLAEAIPASLGALPTTSMAQRDRILPWVEELTESIQSYRLMLSTYLNYMLNKVREVGPEFEEKRLVLDKAVVGVTSKLQIYLPKEFRSVVFRIRRMMSCSWQSPLNVYYLLQRARNEFPRPPIDAAQTIANSLFECYLDMASQFVRGVEDETIFETLLTNHGLNGDASSSGSNVETEVASAFILEHEYFGSDDKSRILDAFSTVDDFGNPR